MTDISDEKLWEKARYQAKAAVLAGMIRAEVWDPERVKIVRDGDIAVVKTDYGAPACILDVMDEEIGEMAALTVRLGKEEQMLGRLRTVALKWYRAAFNNQLLYLLPKTEPGPRTQADDVLVMAGFDHLLQKLSRVIWRFIDEEWEDAEDTQLPVNIYIHIGLRLTLWRMIPEYVDGVRKFKRTIRVGGPSQPEHSLDGVALEMKTAQLLLQGMLEPATEEEIVFRQTVMHYSLDDFELTEILYPEFDA